MSTPPSDPPPIGSAATDRSEPAPAPLGAAPTPDRTEPALSYEAARAQLQQVLSALESGGQPLEESLALWRRGEELADICQRWLDEATQRLDEAIADRGGQPGRST